jgi:NAD(P)-dependent dehydrogenase (short-subunit alcohol dehydrogenase family)
MFEGKRVLITGGASGIGLAVANELAQAGARLVIAGRRTESLEAAAVSLRAGGGGLVIPVPGDVTDATARKMFLDVAERELGGLDVLINNAGVARAGRLDSVEDADVCRMIDVNLTAPILLTRSALPLLRRGKDAMVVNMSSGLGLIGMPFYTIYGATKAGLALFSEALRREVAEQGIHVINVFPIATDTPMMATSRTDAPRESAETVAHAIIEAMRSKDLAVVRGGEARAEMIARNQNDPRAVDEHFRRISSKLEEAVRDHNAM